MELQFFDVQLGVSCAGCGHAVLLRWLGGTEQAEDGREVRIMRAPCVECDQTYECRLRVPVADEFDTEVDAEGTVSAPARVVQLQESPRMLTFTPAETGTTGGQITWNPSRPRRHGL